MNMIRQYKVDADRETGLWLSEPVFVGVVEWSEWLDQEDTEDVYYGVFEKFTVFEDSETSAIEVRWVD